MPVLGRVRRNAQLATATALLDIAITYQHARRAVARGVLAALLATQLAKNAASLVTAPATNEHYQSKFCTTTHLINY
jgi:hypothetical protein